MRHIYKALLIFVFLLTASCSTGDLPSLSIQPSQDVYEQDAVEKTSSMDVIWMIDNSGSMKPFQDQIRKNFISFLKDFTSKNFDDFQIGVSVTDGFLDFNFDIFKDWNDLTGKFLASDLPCKDDETSDCYDYEEDTKGRFRSEVTSEGLSYTNSDLKYTNCDVCYSDPNDKSTISGGRDIRILSNLVLDELRHICELVNNDDDTTNNCEDVNDPGVKISGDEKFLDLFDQIIASVGLEGSGDERALQSIQAARLNPRNKDLFRDETHLAVIIVSDEDDMSVNQQAHCKGTVFDDNSGALYCSNPYPTLFYTDLLELATDKTLGVTVHNIGINPKGDGYQGDYFKGPEFLNIFRHARNPEAARTAYISGMKNNYDDNSSVVTYESITNDDGNIVTEKKIIPAEDLEYRISGPLHNRSPFQSWTDNDPERKECRTIAIPGIKNGAARFFSRRNTELAESLNGVVTSLCADFAESLENISKKIIEATSEFFLGDDNVPSQAILDQKLLFVAIKNVGEDLFTTIARDKTRANGWDYNPINNSIVFFGDAVPENKAKISIVFDREALN